MSEDYLPDDEYQDYFATLGGLRATIAKRIRLCPGMQVLDLATGYGFFAIELARRHENARITGIDLTESNIENARARIARMGLSDRIEIKRMDATAMHFPTASFDMVLNFLGLEDIHMTRGRSGVEQALIEVGRVLKRGGQFCFTAVPPEEMETEAKKTEVALFSYVCGATWLSAAQYEGILEDAGLRVVGKERFYTGKKLTPEQAKAEIRFACEKVPEIYGVATPSFDEVWKRFGGSIEREGMGHYSKLVLFVSEKLG